MHMHDLHLLCIDDAPNNVLDSTQIRKAEARKLAPTATGSIAGSRPVAPTTVAPSIRGSAASSAGSRLSIRGSRPVASISPSSWFLSSKQVEGIERLATAASSAAAGLLSGKQVKGVEGLFAPPAPPAIVVV